MGTWGLPLRLQWVTLFLGLSLGLLSACGGKEDRAKADKQVESSAATKSATSLTSKPASPQRRGAASAGSVRKPSAAPIPSIKGLVTSVEVLPDPSGIPDSATGRANGDFAPELAHNDLLSNQLYRLSDRVGPTAKPEKAARAAVVGFTASWCGPCRASYPFLRKLKEQHGEDLEVVIITTDEDEAGKAKEAQQVRAAGLDAVVLDPSSDTLRAWLGRRRNVPHFYILNTIGEILVQDRGFGKKVKKVLPGQIRYAINNPDYVVRAKKKPKKPRPQKAP